MRREGRNCFCLVIVSMYWHMGSLKLKLVEFIIIPDLLANFTQVYLWPGEQSMLSTELSVSPP